MIFRLSLVIAVLACSVSAQQVRIGVLELFRPRELILRPAGAELLVITAGEVSLALAPGQTARVRLSGSSVAVETRERTHAAPALSVAARDGGPVDVFLSVPGKLERRYRGTVEVRSGDALTAILVMDEETAVASVVAAESAPGTGIEALKAQAVAARSYFRAARSRHVRFGFCDTTHCQFLREPPPESSPAARAAAETRGLVLAYRGRPVSALYSAACGGRTRALPERARNADAYPHFSVDCKYCRRSVHQDRDRKRGWTYGIGLCQTGAAGMASSGATAEQILRHYYPNTTVRPWRH